MAYVYRHIRHDKDIPFYIGISKGSDYSRAHHSKNRNSHWHNIIAKTDYTVEILLDDLTWEEACEKEKEFIALYGKRHDGGILCNMSDGGQGGDLGEEANIKRATTVKGKNNPKAFTFYQYTIDNKFVREWECIMDAAFEYKMHPSNISNCFRGKQKTSAGFKWLKIKLDEK